MLTVFSPVLMFGVMVVGYFFMFFVMLGSLFLSVVYLVSRVLKFFDESRLRKYLNPLDVLRVHPNDGILYVVPDVDEKEITVDEVEKVV